VYAIDLMGSGLSEKSWDIDYSHPAQMERLIAFMDAQNIQQSHLVAHAFGGNLATMIALSYPERVKTLVLVAPTLFFGSTAQIPALVFDLPFLKRWTRVLIQLVLPDAVAEQLRSAVKEDDVVTSELVEDYSRGLSIEGWDEAAMGMARDFHKNALTISLTELQNPVLFMWGAEDGWASSSLIEDIQDELYSMERIDFEGVGHLPMHEVPEDFNAGLIEFLENNQ
jgi:pimeloyl-ACP methyl ester carboxylesterase